VGNADTTLKFKAIKWLKATDYRAFENCRAGWDQPKTARVESLLEKNHRNASNLQEPCTAYQLR
jgi:hypothetical protein